jgi:hypothetical protein
VDQRKACAGAVLPIDAAGQIIDNLFLAQAGADHKEVSDGPEAVHRVPCRAASDQIAEAVNAEQGGWFESRARFGSHR